MRKADVNDELSKCYELLGVAPGASVQELKTAHRDLAKVWHPDRFAHDPRLQQKAQEKLKEINEAYDQVISGKTRRRTRTSSAANQADTHPPVNARRFRWKLILLPALAFGLVFFAASRALIQQQAQNPLIEQAQEATTGEERQQREKAISPTAEESARDKRADRRPSKEAESDGVIPLEQEITRARPLPTVTLTIDPMTGMIATPDCPVKSRMTYPSGAEPQQLCNASHKSDSPRQADPTRSKESRLKSFAKRLASPARLFGGKGESDKRQEVKPSSDDNNR
jgi:hypothetical protein